MRALLVLALLAAGCACDHGPPVPFGLEGQRADVVAADPARPATSTPSTELRDWAEGAAVTVADAPLTIEGVSIRATLAADLDADGDTDALAIALAPEGPALFTAIRNGATFDPATPIALSSLPVADATCTWARTAFVAAAREAAAASFVRVCAAVETNFVVALRVDSRPRVLETFTFDGVESATATLADRDGDGHEDLVLALRVADAPDGAASAELVYFDRPAGLSRDTSQPEASLAAVAAYERPVARRHPDRIAANARRTIALRDALCGPAAHVTVGSTRGIPCGASLALGHAYVVLAADAAHRADALTALDALAALDRSDVTVRDVDRTIAQNAVGGMSGVLTPPAHDGPEARAISTTHEQRLSSLAFTDEDHVVIRGPGTLVTLSTSETTTDLSAIETSLRDPSGRFTVTELRPTCHGPELVIVASTTDPLATPESTRRTIPTSAAAAPCTGESGAPALVVDGLHVLGWAPQGILLARGTSLTLVPLDVEARPAGDPQALALDALPPAPIAGGHATRDASAWSIATPLGVLVLRRVEQDARLVRPIGFGHADGTPLDVAVSPTGGRIAWIEGGHLRWAELSEIAPAPVTP
jgi:hypothetical protein